MLQPWSPRRRTVRLLLELLEDRLAPALELVSAANALTPALDAVGGHYERVDLSGDPAWVSSTSGPARTGGSSVTSSIWAPGPDKQYLDKVISADGRYVVFHSAAGGIVPNDFNDKSDVFLFDRLNNSITLISQVGGFAGQGNSINPTISPNGRYVAFESTAALATPDTDDGSLDVYVWDRDTARVNLASVNTAGTVKASRWAYSPSVSDNGRVVFVTDAPNLVPGTEATEVLPFTAVVMRDLQGTSPTTSMIAFTAGHSYNPVISGSGNVVLFLSSGAELNPVNATEQIFAYHLEGLRQGRYEMVSVDVDNHVPTGRVLSDRWSVTYDGQFVAFTSINALDPRDLHLNSDVYIRDLGFQRTTWASIVEGSQQYSSGAPSISSDGRYVAYTTITQPETEATPRQQQVSLRDLQTGTTYLISKDATGQAAQGVSYSPSISADGRYVAYSSTARSLHPNDRLDFPDVYLWDRTTQANQLVTVNLVGDSDDNLTNPAPVISADGKFLALNSDSPSPWLAPRVTTFASPNVYLADLTTGDKVLASRRHAFITSATANNASQLVWTDLTSRNVNKADDSGRYVAFVSLATDLDPRGIFSGFKVYLRDLGDPTANPPVPPSTTLISTVQPSYQNNHSFSQTMSRDGRYVAFVSDAFGSPFPPGSVIYLWDRTTGLLQSLAPSYRATPQFSANSRYLAFDTRAQLDPNADTDALSDVYVYELATGTFRLASTGAVKGNGDSHFNSISADGNLVAFESTANNLDARDGDTQLDVYVWDQNTKRAVLASLSDDGTTKRGFESTGAVIGGSLVAYTNVLTSSRTRADFQVAVHDLSNGMSRIISARAFGPMGNDLSQNPVIDDTGTRVAFQSLASNLDPLDTDNNVDVYVWEKGSLDPYVAHVTGRGSGTLKGNGISVDPTLSPDGRFLAFSSRATNLDLADTDTLLDVYVRDLDQEWTYLISTNPALGGKGQGDSRTPRFSGDATSVFFDSDAPNLVSFDLNGKLDVFRQTLPGVNDSDGDGVPDAVEDGNPTSSTTPYSQDPRVASLPNVVDGRYVIVETMNGELRDVTAILPSAGLPGGPAPVGSFTFRVVGLSPGDTAEVVLRLPEAASAVYKFGPETLAQADHWYDFFWDGTTGLLSPADPTELHVILKDSVIRSDRDFSLNGEILDPLTPVANAPPSGTDVVLAVTAAPPAELLVGGEFSISFQPRNDGPLFAEDVSFTLVVPSSVEVLADSNGPPVSVSESNGFKSIVYDLGDLAVGAFGPELTFNLRTTVVGSLTVGAVATPGILNDIRPENNSRQRTIQVLPDTEAPELAITRPVDGGFFTSMPIVAGLVRDTGSGNTGVDRVEVTIRRDSDLKWWDGSDWVDGEVCLATEITPPSVPAAGENWAIPAGMTPGTNVTPGSYRITATAFDKGGNQTTAVAAVEIIPAGHEYVVTTAEDGADDLGGSLRVAILHANGNPGTRIVFQVPNNDPNSTVVTIRLNRPLPTITAADTWVLGSTESDFLGNSNLRGPEVVLDGTALPEFSAGLTLSGQRGLIQGLVIQHMLGAGIWITGSTARNNLLLGNYLGTDAIGFSPMPNRNGVVIDAGAQFNDVGSLFGWGATAGQRNLISGNSFTGVYVAGPHNSILSNWIGTRANGTQALPNGDGVVIDSADEVQVGGDPIAAGNLISGNTGAGVMVTGTSQGVEVLGNLIGASADGRTPLGNRVGVLLESVFRKNEIGAVDFPNVISGNLEAGVRLVKASNQIVQANRIGTSADGMSAVPNEIGVHVAAFSTANTVEGNLISGNLAAGVHIEGPSTDETTVRDNTIGVALDRLTPLPNAVGVLLSEGAARNLVKENLVAGNADAGVEITGATTRENTVLENLIGVNVDGALPVGITNFIGLLITKQAHHNVIRDNSIAGNSAGIVLRDEAAFNQIEGNDIGYYLAPPPQSETSRLEESRDLQHARRFPVPNNTGILIALGAHDNRIGQLQGNTAPVLGESQAAFFVRRNGIAFNRGSGVVVMNDSPGNTIEGNDIDSNNGLGMNLQPDGEPDHTVTLNDQKRTPDGPNHLLDAPVLYWAVENPAPTVFSDNTPAPGVLQAVVHGVIRGARHTFGDAGDRLRIVFYLSTSPDPFGSGEGEFVLDERTDGALYPVFEAEPGTDGSLVFTTTVHVDGTLNADGSLRSRFSHGFLTSHELYLTATVTDLGTGDTSEFSNAVRIFGPELLDRDTDLDGIKDREEMNAGDANGDGAPDWMQPSVASFRDAETDSWVTMQSPAGTQLRGVRGIPTEVANAQIDGSAPRGSSSAVDVLGTADGRITPLGFFTFEVHGVQPGGTADLSITLPAGIEVERYLKLGEARLNIFGLTGFSLFALPRFDTLAGIPPDGVGWAQEGNVLHLRLKDGENGDTDLTRDGVIRDPGAVVVTRTAEQARLLDQLLQAFRGPDEPRVVAATVQHVSPHAKFVARAYRALTQVTINPVTLEHYARLLDQGGLTRGQVAAELFRLPSARAYQVRRAFRRLLGRAPTGQEVRGGVRFLAAGTLRQFQARLLAAQGRFAGPGQHQRLQEAFSSLSIERATVERLARDLLGHEAEERDLARWTRKLHQAGSEEAAIAAIVASDAYFARANA